MTTSAYEASETPVRNAAPLMPMALTRSSTDILLAFAPIPDAVRAARHALRERGLNPDLDHTVSLLTSELVGNAVRHAGPLNPSERIVFHAKLSDDHVRVEVADHGPGFDLDAVPDDRMGVRESIIGRMRRNGGEARLRSAPDGGTEVELEMERVTA